MNECLRTGELLWSMLMKNTDAVLSLNPSTCTSDGPLKLTPGLHERMLSALKEAHQKESKA
jgi:hypothetical protein